MFNVSSRKIEDRNVIRATVITNRESAKMQENLFKAMIGYAQNCHINYRNHDRHREIWHIIGHIDNVRSALAHLKNLKQVYC